MSNLLLGIDIGTSSCKVAVFNLSGEVIASKTGTYPVYYPQKGWAEQDVTHWWDAICTCTQEMLKESDINPHDIKGIGVDGQSWACIPIDEDGNVLAKNPIWMDTRAAEQCEKYGRLIGEDNIFNICGNPLKPTYTTPKILWLKEHHPRVYQNTYQFLQSNSYIAYKLAGVPSQEKSQGYGLHFYNMQTGEYDTALAEQLGIDLHKFAPIFECHNVIGTVTEKAAVQTGLAAGTPVVAGGLDAACGTLGTGVIDVGQVQEQGGQAGGMSICTASPIAHKQLILSNHVVPGKWLLQGGTVGGGGVLRWFKDTFGKEGEGYDDLCTLAEESPAGSNGLVFLPYMAGERSPIWDANAKGVFYGVSFGAQRADFVRAVLEGVAFSLRHNIDTAKEAGAKVETLYAMGGAANSLVWTQIKSDITGCDIAVASSDTATTFGAAILAGVGVGLYKNFREPIEHCVYIKRKHGPDTRKKEVYDQHYQLYLNISKNLKGLW